MENEFDQLRDEIIELYRIETMDLHKIQSLRSSIFKAKRLCALLLSDSLQLPSIFYSFACDFASRSLREENIDSLALLLFL